MLLFSDETFEELRSRLARPKFDRYVSVATRDRFVIVIELQAVSEWVGITGAVFGCRDRDDDKLLEMALAGEADCVVTGDADLLVMSPFHGVPILTPRAFIEALVSPTWRRQPRSDARYRALFAGALGRAGWCIGLERAARFREVATPSPRSPGGPPSSCRFSTPWASTVLSALL